MSQWKIIAISSPKKFAKLNTWSLHRSNVYIVLLLFLLVLVSGIKFDAFTQNEDENAISRSQPTSHDCESYFYA